MASSITTLTPNGSLSAAAAKGKSSLRYRKRSVCLSVFYLIFLVVPWVITCVMMFRPVAQSSYDNLPGTGAYTDEDAQSMQRWLDATRAMDTVATVLALPVLSNLLAQAAVRYTQRQSSGRSLKLGQLFALADRGWANIPLVAKSVTSPRLASPLLLMGALLSLVALVQPPIRSVLVRYEPTSIATCADVEQEVYLVRNMSIPYLKCPRNQDMRRLQQWFDPEPSDLAACPRGLIIPKVQRKLADLTESDAQPYLWTETGLGNGTFPHTYQGPYSDKFWYYWVLAEQGYPYQNLSFYASSVPRGTTTGVLRYHALRQQSEAHCETVPRSAFPSTCPGDAPFTASLLNQSMVVRVCSPGSTDRSPWTATRNRQTISEDLWIDVEINTDYRFETSYRVNFTTHCTSNSSLGYFELPSRHNGEVPGPLLGRWPDRADIASSFHDLTSYRDDYNIPYESSPAGKPFETMYDDGMRWSMTPTPGPLATSALALFGNNSFFWNIQHATQSNNTDVLRSICLGTVPFPKSISSMAGYSSMSEACYSIAWDPKFYGTPDRALMNLMIAFTVPFANARTAEHVLEAATFAANEALLTTTGNAGWGMYARQLFSSTGYQIERPVKRIAAIAVVSALLLVQVAAVVALAAYNASFPTWTATLDALAMAKIGREIDDAAGLGPLGIRDRQDMGGLVVHGSESGLIGVLERDRGSEMGDTAPPVPVLGLGAPGVIIRKTASRKPESKPESKV